MIHTCFVIAALGGGGMERVFLTVLRNLDRRRFRPQLILFEPGGVLTPLIPPDVPVSIVGRRGPWDFGRIAVQVAGQLRRTRPDAVLSFEHYGNCATLLAAKLAGQGRVYVSERTHLSRWIQQLRFTHLRRWLVRGLYPTATGVIAVSEAVRTDLHQAFAVPLEHITVIPNPVDAEVLRARARESLEHPWWPASVPVIVAAGRLGPEKDYPMLLQAVAALRRRRPVRLVILGEGPEHARLAALVHKLGITESVALAGFDLNPYRWMARASVFVLTSQYEGLPNVLLEAMALGIPVVSTHYNAPAAHELIDPEVSGLLVPCGDVPALHRALERLLADEPLRRRLAAAATRRLDVHRVDHVVARYEALLAGGASPA